VGGAARTELLRTDGQTEQLRAVLLGRTDGRSCSDGAAAGGAAADGRTELLLGRSCCGRTDGASAGGAAADGRTGGTARTELLWAELRTPARGAAGAADAGEGDPEAGRRRLRERGREQRELEMCRHSVTHSLLSSYPNGPAKGGPNSLAGPNSPSPKLVVRLV
jgi:hypothetical protein